ncbi:hypothetical protein BIY29_03970 [Brenneria alni]|uniref:Uncharacterized protein n=1 Tax=Brenneria alni TaxID=71656 RepID=A0A421DS33_9GAMM|nr:hypothetical protein BIY29_03970 [Brenneria alni]
MLQLIADEGNLSSLWHSAVECGSEPFNRLSQPRCEKITGELNPALLEALAVALCGTAYRPENMAAVCQQMAEKFPQQHSE